MEKKSFLDSRLTKFCTGALLYLKIIPVQETSSSWMDMNINRPGGILTKKQTGMLLTKVRIH